MTVENLSTDQIVTLYTVIAAYYVDNTRSLSSARIERLIRAAELGAGEKLLRTIADALRTSTTDTIVLPAQRFENLSRGKGWCRQGRGASAVWGERDDGGYRVGPGKWTVGGNDGFSRKGEDHWTVKHVTVGAETWTVAS